MNRTALTEALSAWLRATFEGQGICPADHCFQIRSRFRIPGSGPVDFLTARHTRSSPDAKGDPFRIALWMVETGSLGDRQVDLMMRRVHAFQAGYAELLEQAETRGFSAAHRVSVTGNLVGAAVRRSPLTDLLSNWGGSVFFWTWTPTDRGVDVLPYYGKSPSLNASRAQLKGLLDHLPWEDRVEREDAEALQNLRPGLKGG